MKRPAVDIGKLSPAERLQLIESLWESLSNDADAVPLTDAQRNELDRRLDDLDSSDPAGISWEQVLKQLRETYR